MSNATDNISKLVATIRSDTSLEKELKLDEKDSIVDEGLICSIRPKVLSPGSSSRKVIVDCFEDIRIQCKSKGLSSFATFLVMIGSARGTIADIHAWGAWLYLRDRKWGKHAYLPLLCNALSHVFYRYPTDQINEWLSKGPVINPWCSLPTDVSCKCTPKDFGLFLARCAEAEVEVQLNCISTRKQYSFDSPLVNKGCIVDRTSFIPYFLDVGASIILRPRRFGKSFWLATLRAFFTNPRCFLNGYAVGQMCFYVGDTLWDPEKSFASSRAKPFVSCPVLLFDFSNIHANTAEDLNRMLFAECKRLAADNNVEVLESDWGSLLKKIIRKLSGNLTEKRVVVLVDEYDYSLVESSREDGYENLKAVHCEFLLLLKSMHEGILMQCVTGISRWVLKGMHSGANHLRDLTLERYTSQLMGLTEAEVVKIATYQMDPSKQAQLLDALRKHCNGYSFNRRDTNHMVFCPYFVECEVQKMRKDKDNVA